MSATASIKILAADDDEDGLFALESVLTAQGYAVITAPNGRLALAKAESEIPDLILLDVVMPEMDGYQTVKALKADPALRYIPVILLTSKDDLADVVRGFECGADDYIKKPYKREELLARLSAAMRTRDLYRDLQETARTNRELQSELSGRYSFGALVGKSSSMREIYSLVEKVCESDVPVLVSGESGTGKELVARALHANSPRRSRPFVVQNCSAFNDNLLESELFGHVRGAFTGAVRDKRGLFEAADGGTFFLDEIGEMSPMLQVKLLRVLQDGSFIPVGATQAKQVNVRVIGATHRDLREMIRQGTFREDLFYRLNVVNLKLPSLRERKVDVPLLIEHFLGEIAKRLNAPAKALSPEALRRLCDYDWPGNVRELQNEMERAVLMSGKEPEIGLEHLSPQIIKEEVAQGSGRRLEGRLKDAIENLERNMIQAALERLHGNKSEAAKELGISRSNLIGKVKAYGLE